MLSLLTLLPLALARDITFPPVSPYQIPIKDFHASGPSFDLDVSSSNFYGLTTYANLPYVHCLAEKPQDVEPFDIAVLGAPFDTGVTARPGARFGPLGIRLGSRRISAEFSYDVETGRNVFQEWAKVVDCGDAPLTVLDNTLALKQLDKSHKLISGRTTNASDSTFPRIVTLGGDHTTTLSALRSTHERWGKVSVIHFDSHIDTWDPAVLGGGISDYAGVNHGTFLHIAHEEGLILNTSIHAGIRAPVANKHYDRRHDKSCGFEIATAKAIDKIGVKGIVDKIKERTQGSRVYISVDIDVLDPAYAPATGTAEVGGWTTRELLAILEGLEGIEVVGADVGETTGLAAAEIVHSLIRLMVSKPIEA
ncbi:hypothetical protein MBLNU457_5249t2 [Dothideomycetes sp. NU457]